MEEEVKELINGIKDKTFENYSKLEDIKNTMSSIKEELNTENSLSENELKEKHEFGKKFADMLKEAINYYCKQIASFAKHQAILKFKQHKSKSSIAKFWLTLIAACNDVEKLENMKGEFKKKLAALASVNNISKIYFNGKLV